MHYTKGRNANAAASHIRAVLLLLRILELRCRLQRVLRGIHLRDPLVSLCVVRDHNRCRRYGDIALTHAEETAHRPDERIDLFVLDGDVSDLADILVCLFGDVQALHLRREHFVLTDRGELGVRRRRTHGGCCSSLSEGWVERAAMATETRASFFTIISCVGSVAPTFDVFLRSATRRRPYLRSALSKDNTLRRGTRAR